MLRNVRSVMVLVAVVMAMCSLFAGESTFAGSLVGWGSNDCNQVDVPDGYDFNDVAGGGWHSLALKDDSSIEQWGCKPCGEDPPDGNDFVAICAGLTHSLALKEDGSIVGWGCDDEGQATPPDGYNFVAIAGGSYHSIGLTSDGHIITWGNDVCGQCSMIPGGSTPINGAYQSNKHDFAAIAAGFSYSLALKDDGSIEQWGCKPCGENPPDGNDFEEIAAGGDHSLALKEDGSIVGWGCDDEGHASPPEGNVFVAIAAGCYHSLAIKKLTLIQPNGGEFIPAGDTYTILWEADSWDEINDVNICYSDDNGVDWYPVDVTDNDGNYVWSPVPVPQGEPNGSQECLVRICDANDPNVCVESAACFTIFICKLAFDLNGDCLVDFSDFALLASEWVQCGNPYEANCARARFPYPSNGANDVETTAHLSWRAGAGTISHDVYFGIDFNDVNDANTADPNVYMGRQDATTFEPNEPDTIYPNTMDPNTWYYWRIDEINDARGTTTGWVWHFKTKE